MILSLCGYSRRNGPPEDSVVHGFRVFSAEPNYYCLEGACAALMTEIAFVKVNANTGRSCTAVLAWRRVGVTSHTTCILIGIL